MVGCVVLSLVERCRVVFIDILIAVGCRIVVLSLVERCRVVFIDILIALESRIVVLIFV